MSEEIELKGGHVTTDPRLDRLPEFDEASRSFPIGSFKVRGEAVGTKPPRSFTHEVGYWLDQMKEGRCVEFAICHDLLGKPVKISPAVVNQIIQGKLIYWPAQREDAWPGGSYEGASPRYEGTSVLSGVKVATRLGFYAGYRWAFSLEDALLGLGYAGPLILGINWYASMFDTDNEGWLHVNGSPSGGHAILANKLSLVWQPGTTVAQRRSTSWLSFLDQDKSWIGLWNSWNRSWGIDGVGKLSVRNFDRLRKEQGECCIPIGRKPVTQLAAAA